MKHRTRSSPDQRQPQQRNGAVAIPNNANGKEEKVHGRRKRGLSATIVLALPFVAVLATPLLFHLKLQPLTSSGTDSSSSSSNDRILYNAQSGHVRRSAATSAVPPRPRTAVDLKPGEQPPPIAKRRREIRNRSSIMMTDDFREQLEDSHDYDKKARDPLYEGDCEPMRPWQEQVFPNCNRFHELDISTAHSSWLVEEEGKFEGRIGRRFGKINSGGYNDVFRFHLDPPTEEDIVLKALNYGTGFTDRNFDRVRRDALIAERGTFSKYMVDINGHCGLSLLTPYGSQGTLNHYTDSKREPLDKLRMARHAAFGIADAHNLDHDKVSSITQGDLKLDQYLLVDGYFKLGDFNRGRFLRKNKKTGEACTYTIGNNDAKYRSPEEYRYDPETAKIDVWALGSMIYMILTGKGVWTGVNEQKAQKKIASNKSPPLDDKWKESNDPVDRLLVKIMYEWCFVPDPEKRPSAPEVAKFLERESEKIMKEMGLSEEKVKDDRLEMDSSYDS